MTDRIREGFVLLGRIDSWHMIQTNAPQALRGLKEEVVLLTGRVDLAEIRDDDVGLRTKLFEAVDTWLDEQKQ
jgi:hypothetical protein